MIRYINKVWFTVFEGEEDAAAKAAADAAAAKAAADAAAAKGGKFTQEDVNRLLADEKRKHEARTRKAIDELEAIKARATLTDQERTELETRLDNMKNELLTKEEMAKKELEKNTRKFTEELTKTTAERDAWQQRFSDSTIQRTITDAAIATKAINARQVIAILRPDTRLVEALDADGKPTGEMIAKVEFSDVDKDGKPVTLDLTVAEAVKRMSELEEYANLFKADGVGGAGGTNRGSGKPLDAKAIAKNPALYRKLRAEGKI